MSIKNNFIAGVACLSILAVTSQVKADAVPKFSQFPVEKYSYKPTGRLDLSTPDAYNFRTRLREGAKQKSNFAGHYTIVTWGCGTNCEEGALIDAFTGRVVFLPINVDHDLEGDAPDFNPLVFKLNSHLIKIRGDDNVTEGTTATYFFNFDGRSFQQIYKGNVEKADVESSDLGQGAAFECVKFQDGQPVVLHGDIVQSATKEENDDDGPLHTFLELISSDQACRGTTKEVLEELNIPLSWLGHRVVINGMITDGAYMSVDVKSIKDAVQ